MSSAEVSKNFQKTLDDRLRISIYTIISQEFGNRKETYLATPRRRLLDILFLADDEWYRANKQTYLGNWIRYNNGPFLENFLKCLSDLDGIEITETQNGYIKGHYSRRLAHCEKENERFDPQFGLILTAINRLYYFNSDKSIQDIIYANPLMEKAGLGDSLFAKIT